MKEDKETSETNGSIEVTKYDTIQLPDDDSSKGKILSYFILIHICIGGLCQSFCYDNPIPLQTQIEEYLNLSSTKYNLLFSFYYLPNIVTPFLIGYLSDACGRKVGMMLSSVLILLGQLLFVIGILPVM